LGILHSVDIEEARSIYEEIVDEARQHGAVASEQKGRLPVARLEHRFELGEVKMIEPVKNDYRVIWYPPETHIGQDLVTGRASDEEDMVDVSATPPDAAVARIMAYEPPDCELR